MTEGRVPEIVRQSDRLDQILIQPQRAGNGAPQLRDLERMSEAGAKQVPLMIQKNLCFINEAPERG